MDTIKLCTVYIDNNHVIYCFKKAIEFTTVNLYIFKLSVKTSYMWVLYLDNRELICLLRL